MTTSNDRNQHQCNNDIDITKIIDVICKHCIKSIFPEQNKLIQLKDVYVINPNKKENDNYVIQFDSWNDMWRFISLNHITELYVKNHDNHQNMNNVNITENNIHDLLTIWQPDPSIQLENISARLLEIKDLICQTLDDLYDKYLIEYNNNTE